MSAESDHSKLINVRIASSSPEQRVQDDLDETEMEEASRKAVEQNNEEAVPILLGGSWHDSEEDNAKKGTHNNNNDKTLDLWGDSSHHDDNNNDDDERSAMSDSFCEDDDDDDSSCCWLDKAQKDEQQVRKTLFWALLSACGMVFAMSLLQKLMARVMNNNNSSGEDEMVDASELGLVAKEAATTAGATSSSAKNAAYVLYPYKL